MTATTYLEWEDQATGANNNTWGDVQDSNNTIFELAIARLLSVATTGGTTALTTAQNRYPTVAITGVLVSNATIQVRTAEKNWRFINQTTGAFSVTVKTAAGTGVTIPRRRAVKVYCDGTNVLYARHDNIPHATAGGTADVITGTFEPPTTSNDLQEGYLWELTAGAANATTTPTFNPDATGALTITKYGGQALVAGDIRAAGHKLLLAYKSGGVELLNPSVVNGAVTNADNSFSVKQTVSITDAVTATTTLMLSTDHLSSGTPAAGFGVEWRARLHNAANTLKNCGAIMMAWVDATDTSEDSRWEFWTMAAGAARAMVGYIQTGLVLGSATGADKGLGTVNVAIEVYRNGKAIAPAALVKTANTAINSTTLASDADLQFSMAASKTYRFHARINANGSAASSGIKFGITGPAIGAGSIGCGSMAIDAASGVGSAADITAYGTIDAIATTSPSKIGIDICGVIVNGANAGTFALQFAQNAVSGTTTVYAGSQLTWSEI